MAGFNSQRTPYTSQHVASLGTIPSAQVFTQQEENHGTWNNIAEPPLFSTQQEGTHGTGNNMAMFTNVEFNDFDMDAGIAEPPLFFEAYPEVHPTYQLFPPPAATSAYPPNYQPVLSTSSSNASVAPDQHPLTMSPATTSTRTSTPPSAASLSAEADKRQRSNEASARCRQRQRARDQARGRDTVDLEAKVRRLQRRERELLAEKEWLKGLLM